MIDLKHKQPEERAVNAVAKIREAEPVTSLDPLAKLREPFPAHQVSQLPKESKRQREEREADRSKGVNCATCGGWHHRNAVHLDYVGHAALTDRLLDVDPLWSWEPVAFTPEGLPAFDRNGGLWIKLTVCGMTRLGYGNADGKSGGDAVKEIIGDALRNAAMRFGAALDLWHKGDLHADGDDESRPSMAEMAANLLRGCGSADLFKDAWTKNFEGWKKAMSPEDYAKVQAVKAEMVARFTREAEEAKAREAAKAKSEPAPLDVLEGDEIPF